ncbi:general secretion pathway protein GspL [Acinetobacter sp. 194]|uniref:type II secretion system protein GspL n=1 Tax=Acinetobacter shaoyimingii TaxID=2715164 RepID=UPI00140B9254|nr:type II secretion system protein GspL [Acinetobacter shaoyimingii]NHB57088.1 general secretion pathway protein GspL [Acinetobacter shaoyimingii]
MLYLWMPEADGVWQWSKGDRWIQAKSMEQLIQDITPYQGQDAVVFFPSREVQILQQTMTKTQYKQLGSDGIRYLLEEFVILPIDHMSVLSHFQAPDQVSVLGIAKNAVQTMQHALTLIPVKITALLPDFLILPKPEQKETIITQINGRLLARDHEFHGNSIDDLSLYLEIISRDQVFKYDGLSQEQSNQLFAVGTTETLKHYNYQFEAPAKPKQHPFNVLPKQKGESSQVAGYWKACAAVLVCLLLVQFSYDLLRWAKLKKLADQTAVIAIQQYKSWFNEPTPITEQNLKSQFQYKLDANRNGNTQALQLLSRVGPVLMQHQIIASRINYDASSLNMDLIAKSAQGLQTLVSQLNQQGFKAELGNIQTQDSNVLGSVKIQ